MEAGAWGHRGESSRERQVWATTTHRSAQLTINRRQLHVVPQAAMSCPGAAAAVLPSAGPLDKVSFLFTSATIGIIIFSLLS